jgi:hypothetical protein
MSPIYIGADINLEALPHLAQGGQKNLPVFIVGKDRLTLVAPGQHVVQGPLVFDPPCPCHQCCLSTIALVSK